MSSGICRNDHVVMIAFLAWFGSRTLDESAAIVDCLPMKPELLRVCARLCGHTS